MIGMHAGTAHVIGQGEAELALRLQRLYRPQRLVQQAGRCAGKTLHFQALQRIAARECAVLLVVQAQAGAAQAMGIGGGKKVVNDEERGRHGGRLVPAHCGGKAACSMRRAGVYAALAAGAV